MTFNQQEQLPWIIKVGNSPLVATAIHSGHAVRDELKPFLALSTSERLREEDPFTDGWTRIAPTQIIGKRSRFEVDLNRSPDKAVYLKPEDAWGLQVWNQKLPEEVVHRSQELHTQFYKDVTKVFKQLERTHGKFIVFDLHSYNHRREGPEGPTADPEKNPEVNIGTGSLDRGRWGSLVDRFINDLRAFEVLGRSFDVRENVKFQGGYFPKWIHQEFPDTGCALAIEFKKVFMDEWTGEAKQQHLQAIKEALASTVPGILESLKTVE